MKRNALLLILGLIVVVVVAGYTLTGGKQEPTSAEYYRPIDHQSVSTEDHCSDSWFGRLFDSWFGSTVGCREKDDQDHYLKLCECYCKTSSSGGSDCEWNRSSPGATYSKEAGSNCGARYGENDNCGTPVGPGQ